VDDFNFTEDIIYSPLSTSDLTASAFPRSNHHHKTSCDDLQYGCCKIYSQCKIKNGYLDYKEHILTYHRITPKDRIQSNCYSLDHLVHMWNVEYKSDENCQNSKFGCCSTINTACDFALRSKRSNNQDTIDFFKQHLHHSHRITIPKKDKPGSYCPDFGQDSTFNIVYAFNHGYPEPIDDLYFIIGMLFFICFLGLSK